jgi:hypothetical protein
MRRLLLASLSLFGIFLFCSPLIAMSPPHGVWEDRVQELWIDELSFANDEGALLKNNTFEKLTLFFVNCSTPEDFYWRIRDSVISINTSNPWQHDLEGFDLVQIVDLLFSGKKPVLWCHQQAVLFAAGVKAMFSHFDEQLGRFVLNEGCGTFRLELWRSFSLTRPVFPYRSHRQLVIDTWNGNEMFSVDGKMVDKIEVDTAEGEPIREWHKTNECLFYPFLPARLNSIMYTS